MKKIKEIIIRIPIVFFFIFAFLGLIKYRVERGEIFWLLLTPITGLGWYFILRIYFWSLFIKDQP